MNAGTLVKWNVNGTIATGRIIANGGDMAQVKANGATYELPVSRLRIIPTCQRCGKEITSKHKDKNTKYCSRACLYEARRIREESHCRACGKPLGRSAKWYCSQECYRTEHRAEFDQMVFVAIVEHKASHDGLSPTLADLATAAHINRVSVERVLKRLIAAGRIRLEGTGVYRGIIVIGARWVYEGEK